MISHAPGEVLYGFVSGHCGSEGKKEGKRGAADKQETQGAEEEARKERGGGSFAAATHVVLFWSEQHEELLHQRMMSFRDYEYCSPTDLRRCDRALLPKSPAEPRGQCCGRRLSCASWVATAASPPRLLEVFSCISDGAAKEMIRSLSLGTAASRDALGAQQA